VSDRTPDALRARLAEVTEIANAEGYDAIEAREVAGFPSLTVFDLMRGDRVVATFSDLDRLELFLKLPR